MCGLDWLSEKGEHSIGSLPTDSIILPLSSSSSHVGKLITNGDSTTVFFHPSPSFLSSSIPVQINGTPITSSDPISLNNDENGKQSVVTVGEDVTFFVLKRSTGLGVRVKNKKSEKLTTFKGLEYFDYNAQAKVVAKFIPHEKVYQSHLLLFSFQKFFFFPFSPPSFFLF